MDEVHLLFVGAPLLDIVAHCEQEQLNKYGLKSDDCVNATQEHEEIFRTVFNNPDSQLSAGGSSQNTARIAKWTLGEKAKVAFAGCVGKDAFADKMSQCLLSEGVEPLYVPLSGESTGICACLLNSEGDRSMIARLGAAALFARNHLLTEEVEKKLESALCVFVEGYFFAHSPDVILSLVEKCSQTKQIFSLSLSAEYICRTYSEIFLKALPRVDVLLSNEAEAKAIAQSLGMASHITVEGIAGVLASRDRQPDLRPRIVIVTRGPDPVLVVQGTDSPQYFPVPTGIKVLDSVGCGDAMAGAFLAVYTLTGDISTAVRTGIKAAVEIAQVSGCNPTRKNLYPLDERLLNK